MKLILSIICIALLVLFAYQVMSYPLGIISTDEDELLKENNIEKLEFELPELALLNNLSEYAEIIQRPLFAKDRKAASVVTNTKVTTIKELEDLILIGTASSQDLRVGIILDSKSKEIERVKVGQIYANWKIVEIHSEQVVFKNRSEEQEYRLFLTPNGKQVQTARQQNSSNAKKKADASNKSRIWSKQKKYQAKDKDVDEGKNYIDRIEAKSKQSSKSSNDIYKYYKKSDVENSQQLDSAKSIRKSPIKIPNEEEKNPSYYEALGDEGFESEELSEEEFYLEEGEEMSSEDLKTLKSVGSKIFDDYLN